jgi:hypothetical protein
MEETETHSQENSFDKEVVNYLIEENLKSKYGQILKKEHKVGKKKIKFFNLNSYMLRAAAMLVVVSGLIFGIARMTEPNSSQLAIRLAQDTYILGNQEMMRGDVGSINQNRVAANTAFVNKKYGEAVIQYEKLKALNEANDVDLFYLAVAYLKSEKADARATINLLQQLPENSGIQKEATWFKALAYAALSDNGNAKKILNEMVASGDYKAIEAKRLLTAFK